MGPPCERCHINGDARAVLVDCVVLGDTPFSVSVQSTLRGMGFSSILIYRGNEDTRYMYAEEIDIPHSLCTYTLRPHGKSGVVNPQVLPVNSLMAGVYIDWFRNMLGGDYRFFYDLATCMRTSSKAHIRIVSIRKERLESRGGVMGDIGDLSLKNKYLVLPNGERANFGFLVVAESLKTFLARVGIPDPGLNATSLGVVWEEFVDLIPASVEFGDRSPNSSEPMISISRGFLRTKFVRLETDKKVNLTLQDYVKIPNMASMEVVYDLESSGGLFFFGPRATWNSALTHESELLRLMGDVGDS